MRWVAGVHRRLMVVWTSRRRRYTTGEGSHGVVQYHQPGLVEYDLDGFKGPDEDYLHDARLLVGATLGKCNPYLPEPTKVGVVWPINLVQNGPNWLFGNHDP